MHAHTETTPKKKKRQTPALAPASADAPVIDDAALVRAIPLELIDESPTNPRKTFAGVEELAADVRRRGVLEPALVRTSPNAIDAVHRFELVFGARRFRASRIAGRPTLPCMVRVLSDAEVLEIQIVENAQREDLHPLEEADAYKALHEQHEYSVEDLAAKVAKSAAYVYGRLKLCELVPDAREAFLAERLTPATALLVARIPVELQAKAAEEIAYGGDYIERSAVGDVEEEDDLEDAADAEIDQAKDRATRREMQLEAERRRRAPMGLASARAHVLRKYMLRLELAQFDRDDPKLVPAAGACGPCPKRTGSQAQLFADIASADVCTDPACYTAKKEAGWTKRAAEAKAAGQVVLEGKKAKEVFQYGHLAYNTTFADLGAKRPGDRKGRTWREALGDKAPPATLARDESAGTVHELVDKKALAKAAKAAGFAVDEPRSTPSSNYDKKHREEQAKRKREQELQTAIAPALLEAIVARVVQRAPTDALWRQVARLVVQVHIEHLPEVARRRKLITIAGKNATYEDLKKSERALLEAVEKLKGMDLFGLIVELLVVDDVVDGYEDTSGTSGLVSLLKIDAKALQAKAKLELAATSKTKALPAAKGKPKPGTCSTCGCTNSTPCLNDLGPCKWANKERTLCSNCDTTPSKARKTKGGKS